MGDDVGNWNISAYNRGMMGYRTPNIDRIAKEGETSPIITPSSPAQRDAPPSSRAEPDPDRLLKVGSGQPRKASPEAPTHRRPVQAAGLRDRPVRQEPSWRPQRILPTVHGFDEFFGNLYHLNAEEEPENPDYPKNRNSRRASARAAS